MTTPSLGASAIATPLLLTVDPLCTTASTPGNVGLCLSDVGSGGRGRRRGFAGRRNEPGSVADEVPR